ncbi:MAG: DNA replication and repair protein RecF [Candidatus Doudnabacteria bacterium]
MRLQNISLENFRNYKKISIAIDADLVLILGPNAAGKTNFLESIYFLSRLKSFRAPDNLLVKNQEDFFSLTGLYGARKLEAILQTVPVLKRQFKLDDLKTKRGFWQPFPVVLFVPNDLNLFHLGPILRRKYLDETLSQTDQAYSMDLESLDHVLKQKSALLEQIYTAGAGPEQTEQLDFWNQQLAPIAFRITNTRQKFIDFLNLKIQGKIQDLTGFNDSYLVEYKRTEASSEAAILEYLEVHKQAEIRSGKNLVGPHRDDFEIKKNNEPNLYSSSRGELRAQILALKLLQAEYLSEAGKKPIILLDDVFSELDEVRRAKLIENLSGHQIFITSTEERHLPRVSEGALVLKVENNTIK